MAPESTRKRELSEFMADHVFGHKHILKRSTIVYLESVPHKLGHNRARTGPGFDRHAPATLSLSLYLSVELFVDVWSFFQTSTHGFVLDLHRVGALDPA